MKNLTLVMVMILMVIFSTVGCSNKHGITDPIGEPTIVSTPTPQASILGSTSYATDTTTTAGSVVITFNTPIDLSSDSSKFVSFIAEGTTTITKIILTDTLGNTILWSPNTLLSSTFSKYTTSSTIGDINSGNYYLKETQSITFITNGTININSVTLSN